MATGSQNMTTYIAKQIIGDITNADWSGALLHSGKDGKSNSIDTWIFADDYGSASSNYGIKHNQTEDTIEFVGASTTRTTIHLGKSEIVVSHLVGGADTWYTARTLTIGNTGKSVNGGSDVSWSKDEILGGSGTTTFLRADKSWTNILTGPFYSTGSPGFQNVTAADTWAYLQLKSGTLGWDIASNSSQNSGALDFRPHKSTNHGIMISQDGGLYFRNPATEGIYYQGTKANYRMIRFLDNSSSTDGNGIIIGGAGYVGIGSGESGDQSYTGGGYTAGSETLVLSSDGDIRLLPTQQSGYNVAYETLVTTNGLWVGRDGNTTREMDIGVRSGAGSLYMWSHAAVAGERGLWLPAHGSGGAYALVCADTNNTSYLQGHRIGIKNTDSASGYGLSLYNGQYNGVPEYGMFFGGTGTFGKFGDVSADWATYFTMNRNDTRGWIFKSNGTAKNSSYNVASISGRGHFTGSLSPSSWIDGQRYTYAAYNIADYSNTGSYNPWMRATNTWSSGADTAKVGRWFSFGTLGTRFHWIGSTTTRTGNSYDNVMTFDIANGALYANGLIQSDTGFADHYNGSATKLAYSQSGLAGSAISWMTCWNGYELRAISKAEVFNVVRDNGGDSRWVNVTGDTMTGTLTVTSTGNNRATVYIRSAGDVPMDLYLGSKNTNYWSISCRESANPYLGFYWAGSSGGWALLMHTNKHVEIPVHAYVGGYNNTSYALSTNSFICNSWVRTKGSTGWYNEDYSGGWYMTDVKWIRSYNSKPVLIDIGTNNAYGIGTHRLALGLAGGSHTSIMLKGGDVMYGFAVNNDGNWYFGRRTSKSFESTSGDAYLLYGSSTSFYPYTDNSVNLGASSKRWATCYAVDFHGYLNGNISGSSASCTGNAKTATTLQTARNINGTSFNGSANITTANWGTARNFTIKDYNSNNAGTAVSVNGSGAVTLLMPSTIYCADVRSGKTRIVSDYIGFYQSNNADGKRYGFIECDVNRMYFRKENSSTQDHYFDFGAAMYVNGAIGCSGSITTNAALQTGSGITIRRDPSSGNCKIWFATNAAVNKWRIGVDGNDRFAISAYADGEGNYDFWVYNNGACYYKTSIGASSRYIKHNIRSLTMNTGNIIDRMEPVSFVFNNDPKETTNLGFIYEDLVKILPEVCFHGEGEDNNLGINYSGIIPVLTKEIQNLRKRLAAVETELNSYRSKT